MPPKKASLGELLIEKGLITAEQLSSAIDEQKKTGERLGSILVKRGFISQTTLGKILEAQVGIEYISLTETQLDKEVIKLLPEHLIRRYKALPIKKENNKLYVAMLHPINLFVIDELKLLTGMKIVPLITTDRELTEAINKQFDIKEKTKEAIEDFKRERGVEDLSKAPATEALSMESLSDDVPVIRLVNSIIVGAIQSEASDIHLEPHEPQMRVRYRIDGMLHDTMTIPKYIESACISRIKVMAGLNIAEHRVPQDGQIPFNFENKNYDLRVSTMPTKGGEKIVIRLLDKEKLLIGVPALGMSNDQLEIFNKLINTPWGMILVAGPTGSGKTTTLYAAIHSLNSPDRNIVTIEDPIEFRVDGINQTQVNPKAGITFATGLRAILRQDPNIIMVGEIRDEETARLAVHAALTGQLLLSTIHTTDAPSVTIRLLEMGVEAYLVSSCIIGVIAQRLIRVICPACKERYEPSKELLDKLNFSDEVRPKYLYKGKGCSQCNYTGYRGRTGIFEVMTMTKEIGELIRRKSSVSLIKEEAINSGMRSLYDSGLLKVAQGITTAEELLRVAYKEE